MLPREPRSAQLRSASVALLLWNQEAEPETDSAGDRTLLEASAEEASQSLIGKLVSCPVGR